MASRRVVRAAAAAFVLALGATACGGGGGGEEASGGSTPRPTVEAATTSLPPVVEAPATTPPPPETTTSLAPQPEVVEVVMGPSKVTFTYPAGLSPDLRPAFDQYLAFLVAGMADGLDPNPDRPEIDATSTGDVNRSWRERSAHARQAGTRFSGPFVSNPTASSLADSEMLLNDCGIDEATTVDAAGRVVVPRRTSFELIVARLELTAGNWKVAAFYPTGKPCEPS